LALSSIARLLPHHGASCCGTYAKSAGPWLHCWKITFSSQQAVAIKVLIALAGDSTGNVGCDTV